MRALPWERLLPYAYSFIAALVATLVLVPPVRRLNMKLGMIDMPGGRRINKTAVPRGGGIALASGLVLSYAVVCTLTGIHPLPGVAGFSRGCFWTLMALAAAMSAVGYADDKFSMPPKLKLFAQIAIALGAWHFAGLGFFRLWPDLPQWLDCAITVLWICGAVNAFNLIDGIDGLASGLALVAVLGMAGTLLITNRGASSMFYIAFAGSLIGFLRYNSNPASIFLGDAGSMFIGFLVATIPLALQTPNSLLVSVGMPVLAMGVPVFDTALAILRRTIRRIAGARSGKGGDNVMKADCDHTHHRILRAVGLDQRKAARILYAVAAFFVGAGLVGTALESRAGGLWLLAVAVGSVVVFKDVAQMEFFESGLLARDLVLSRDKKSRRRVARLSVPLLVVADLVSLAAAFLLCSAAASDRIDDARRIFRVALPVMSASVFFALVSTNIYKRVWSRATTVDFIALFISCCFGTVAGVLILSYAVGFVLPPPMLAAFAAAFPAISFAFMSIPRLLRPAVRDVLYSIDRAKAAASTGVSRILVYGSGLRCRAFTKELVRTMSSCGRVVVGIIDDDIILRGRIIGGVKVVGTLFHAPTAIKELRADAVVIACQMSEERLGLVRKTLAPTGVKLTRFSLMESVVPYENAVDGAKKEGK